jgi:hypothetical protein
MESNRYAPSKVADTQLLLVTVSYVKHVMATRNKREYTLIMPACHPVAVWAGVTIVCNYVSNYVGVSTRTKYAGRM